MTTATVTAIEPTTVEQASETGRKELQEWEIKERTYKRVLYEYDRALYDVKILDGDYKTVYTLGHILGKSITEIKEDLSHVEA
jgi:hypothetical protein